MDAFGRLLVDINVRDGLKTLNVDSLAMSLHKGLRVIVVSISKLHGGFLLYCPASGSMQDSSSQEAHSTSTNTHQIEYYNAIVNNKSDLLALN